MKYYLIFLILCGIALGAAASLAVRSRTLVPSTTPRVLKNIRYSNATSNLISVAVPLPGSEVPKEFIITGSARGTWYFEASFPVNIISDDGEVLAQLPAQASGDWMTQEFVPFTAKVKIISTYVGPATIILKKDNPSAIPQNDATVSFDVFIK